MKLTVCLITKNEERCLARCLDSLGEIADAVVVADTGSTDRTREIARERGARVIEIPWRDDFAWAKNQALAAAEGDWILFPDADEYFNPGGAAALRAMLENDAAIKAETDAVALRRYEGTDFSAPYTSVLRVFRLTPTLRYTGAIHEDLRDAGAPPRVFDAPPAAVFLWHDGYDAARAGAKIARNMRIMEKQLRSGESDNSILFHMSKTLDRQKERERIWEYSREFLRRDGSASSLCLKAMLLADMALEFAPDPALALEGRRWLKEEALRRFPAQPGACVLAGNECLERGDWGAALPLYARAAELWEKGFDDFGDSDFRQEKSRPLVYTRLGRCRQALGDYERAR
ncbi:MAG: glycosyltransferase family 2 protein, partial [Gracilibacteraceae bacterium]|nr:glycosyltransferase family 2 protein [Gracilibacteraceae bacterium]